MQNITIEYQNERDELLERLEANFVDVLLRIPGQDYESFRLKYPWISSIDPFGNTTFNLLQWPFLIKEFSEIKEAIKDKKAQNILGGLILFLNKIKEENHTYLKFIGD